MKKIGIYKITNPVSKVYIGSSQNIEHRKNTYKNLSNKEQPKIHRSILKYGWENHIFEILEECEVEKLYSLERSWGLFYNVLDRKGGLNCYLPGYNEIKGIMSQETKDKISLGNKGKVRSEEYKINIGNKLRGRKGKKLSKEHILNISLGHTGKNLSEETKRKISNGNKGKIRTLDIIEKNRKANNKIILDTSNGIFYSTVKEAAEVNKINYSYLVSMLKGRRNNNTNFIYA